MNQLIQFCLIVFLALATGCQTGSFGSKPSQADGTKSHEQKQLVLRGVHLLLGSDAQAAALQEEKPKLAAVGVNALVLETDYNFEFKSHPELSSPGYVTQARAHELAAEARRVGNPPHSANQLSRAPILEQEHVIPVISTSRV